MRWWAILGAGCGWWDGPPEPAPPDPVPAPAPTEPLRFVRASLLRLREAPDPEAAWSPLAINTRIRVLDAHGDWLRILAPDGRVGFVHRDFVGDAPVTVQDVRDEIERATDPAARVSWWERGAALAPADPEMLGGLVGAYREAGRAEDAARVEQILRTGEADRFDRWFPGQRDEIQAITEALRTTTDAEALIGLWQRARDVTLAMGEPLAALYDRDAGFVEGDPRTMLAERMPWAELALYAGGAQPALELAPEAWKLAAGRTAAAWDDAFFVLVTSAYESASARGWARWQRRTGDFGGCSTFGTGDDLHLTLLRQTDGWEAVPAVLPAVKQIRAAVLADLEKPVPDEFPYCTAVGQPTPVSGLLAEAQSILASVALTDAERAMIEARIVQQFASGQPAAP